MISVEPTYSIPEEATASLAAFRRWATSDESPERGRFDFSPSAVLGTSYRLDRAKDRLGAWQYDLVSK